MELKLLKPHTRAGIQLRKGDVIDVPEAKVEWFIKTGTAEKIQIIMPDSLPKPSARKKRSRKKS